MTGAVLTIKTGGYVLGYLMARFDSTQDNQKASEYVIIGTLASFGWAMAAAYGTKFALIHLTP